MGTPEVIWEQPTVRERLGATRARAGQNIRYGAGVSQLPESFGRRGSTVLTSAGCDLVRPSSAHNARAENQQIITTFGMVDHVQIGIPEGALDVKRALTERAIFFSAEGRVLVGCVPYLGYARAR